MGIDDTNKKQKIWIELLSLLFIPESNEEYQALVKKIIADSDVYILEEFVRKYEEQKLPDIAVRRLAYTEQAVVNQATFVLCHYSNQIACLGANYVIKSGLVPRVPCTVKELKDHRQLEIQRCFALIESLPNIPVEIIEKIMLF